MKKVISKINSMKELLTTLFGTICSLFIYQFDGLDLILKRRKLSEKQVVLYTILNYLFFTKIVTIVTNSVLQFNSTQRCFLTLLFGGVGLASGIYMSYIEEHKLNIVTIYQAIKIGCRIQIMFMVLMMGINLIAKIPIVGPIGLLLFIIIEGPKCIVGEIKRFV